MNLKYILRKWVSLLVLSTGFSLVGGCGKESSSDSKIIQTTPSAPASAPVQATNQPTMHGNAKLATIPSTATEQTPNSEIKSEEYQLLKDNNELKVYIEAQLTLARGTPTDDGDVEGKISLFYIAGKVLDLETTDIVHDADKAWVVTKKYGRIRITCAYSGGLCIWLTPSQKASFKKLLLLSESEGAAPSVNTTTTATMIYDAVKNGDLGRVKALLNDNPGLVSSKDSQGLTPLLFAAASGSNQVVELLLANKADVNAKDNGGRTPLHWAAAKGYKEVAELLLASKAEVNIKNNTGLTPLGYAALNKHYDLVELLRQHGGHE